jgi:heptosyltransferase I
MPTDALPLDAPPASICLLRLSAIGDVCHAVPVVRALQGYWPQARITWVIGALEARLVGDLPGVEFIIFDKAQGWRAYRDLRHRMMGRRYDVLLHMQVAIRASAASLLIPARIRLGFDRARAKDGQWLFTNAQIASRPREHVLESFLGFLDALGVPHPELRWDIPLPPGARAFAAAQLPGDVPVLAISPCSSARLHNYRNWSAERYAAVADHAAERHGMRVVLTGGPTALEREYAEAICAQASCAPLNLIGQTDLKQLLAVLDRATVLVSPDSGPAHMATAVGTPVIGLYATSNPGRTGPYLSRRWTVDRYAEALRADAGKDVEEVAWGRRVRDPRAMERITVADVMERLDVLLAEPQRGHDSTQRREDAKDAEALKDENNRT